MKNVCSSCEAMARKEPPPSENKNKRRYADFEHFGRDIGDEKLLLRQTWVYRLPSLVLFKMGANYLTI